MRIDNRIKMNHAESHTNEYSIAKNEKREERRERHIRMGVSRSMGATWFWLLVMSMLVVNVASLIATDYFGPYMKPVLHSSNDIYTFIIMGGVFFINVLLLIPYMLAISDVQQTSKRGDSVIDSFNVGAHRGISRYRDSNKSLESRATTVLARLI